VFPTSEMYAVLGVGDSATSGGSHGQGSARVHRGFRSSPQMTAERRVAKGHSTYSSKALEALRLSQCGQPESDIASALDLRPVEVAYIVRSKHIEPSREAMYEFYMEGATLQEVAVLFGSSLGAVEHVFQSADFPRRQAGELSRLRHPRDEVTGLHALYLQGVTLAGLSERIGVSTATLSSLFKREGLPTRKRGRPPSDESVVTPLVERVANMRAGGVSAKAIAEELGASRQYVHQLLDKARIAGFSGLPAPRAKGLDLAHLPRSEVMALHQLHVEGTTLKELGRMFCTRDVAISELFVKEGLPVRPRGRQPSDKPQVTPMLERVSALHAQGLRAQAIAGEVGLSRTRVYTLLRAAREAGILGTRCDDGLDSQSSAGTPSSS